MPVETVLPAAAIPSAAAGSITTPFQFVVTGEDNLRVRVWNSASSATLLISIRAVDTNGHIQVTNQSIALNAVRVLQEQLIALGAGYILSVSAECLGTAVQRGQCFVQVDLVRGFSGPVVTLGTLIQGYVASFMGLAYPGTPLVGPLDGPGWVHSVFVPAPAAASDIIVPVPVNAVWAIRAFATIFTTSAVVANRAMMIAGVDSVSVAFWRVSARMTQPASTLWLYTFAPGVDTDTVVPVNNSPAANLPWPNLLTAQCFFRTLLTFSAGDQFSPQNLQVEEWISPWF